jgi:hypothetical protein
MPKSTIFVGLRYCLMAFAAIILLSAAPLHPAADKGKAVPSFFNARKRGPRTSSRSKKDVGDQAL